MRKKALKQDGKDTLLHLRIQPRSSRNSIEGEHGEQIKVRLTAPPVDGKANKALLIFLAKALGLRRAQLSLHSGEKARDKVVRISDVDCGAIAERLTALGALA